MSLSDSVTHSKSSLAVKLLCAVLLQERCMGFGVDQLMIRRSTTFRKFKIVFDKKL